MSRRDDDLRTLLIELERTLDELDEALRAERPRRPTLPTASDLLRFTDRYTVPALIAVLEAAVRSLRLFRRLLGAAEPAADSGADREGRGARPPGTRSREEASAGLAAALSELRAALDAADLPPDAEARSIVREARDLTAEVERRLDASGREGVGGRDDRRRRPHRGPGRGRDRRPDRRRGVTIEVTEEPADEPSVDGSEDASSSAGRGEGVEVDVEAELESIREEVNGPRAERGEAGRGDAAGDDTAEAGDGSDERSAGTNDGPGAGGGTDDR